MCRISVLLDLRYRDGKCRSRLRRIGPSPCSQEAGCTKRCASHGVCSTLAGTGLSGYVVRPGGVRADRTPIRQPLRHPKYGLTREPTVANIQKASFFRLSWYSDPAGDLGSAWENDVSDYLWLELSVRKDSLPALGVHAQRTEKLRGNNRYVAVMWKQTSSWTLADAMPQNKQGMWQD